MFKKQENSEPILIDLTYSNDKGCFLFKLSSLGEYILSVTALGHEPKKYPVIFEEFGLGILLNIFLDAEEIPNTGKIIGKVTDLNNEFLPFAEVILYKLTDSEELVPIAHQKTDENGNYKFLNVPQGNYKIISKSLIN